MLRLLQSMRFYDGLQIICIGYFTEIDLEMVFCSDVLIFSLLDIIGETPEELLFRIYFGS